MKNINPLVSIIIANYNGKQYLDNCLKSVLISNYKNFELLIVDDGSTDQSLQIIGEYLKVDKRIKLLKNRDNLGASASRNKALKVYKGEIVIFLDNDTEVTKKWIDNLIASLLKDQTVGAAQALLLDFKNRDLIQMAGGRLMKQVAWLIPYNQWEKYKVVQNKLNNREIIAISAALAVKKEVLNLVIGFDEKEAVYTEDIDFSWRVWLSGYKIVLASNAIVYHHTKSIIARANMNASLTNVYFHLTKNSIRSIIKNYQLENVARYLFIAIIIHIGRGLLVLLRRQDLSALIGSVKGIRWSVANIKNTLFERAKVQKNRNVRDQELLGIVVSEESLFSIYIKYFKQTKLL